MATLAEQQGNMSRTAEVLGVERSNLYRKMKAFGHEFFLRYCWEMDGDRRQGEIKGPQKFIAAWQRMYGIFRAEHADNVIWVWTPNAAGFKDGRKYTGGNPPAPSFYPGDEYVDWIAPTATTGASPSATRATAGARPSRSSTSSSSRCS